MISWQFLLVLFFLCNGIWATIFIWNKKKIKKDLMDATCMVSQMIEKREMISLDAEKEGDLSKLFHEINHLARMLSAYGDNQTKEKIYLKNTLEDISHQLKTPLAALNIYVGILQDENLEPSQRQHFIDLSEKELERIEHFIQNLLKLSKLDAGTIDFVLEEQSLEDLLLEVYERFQVRAEKENKKLILDLADVSFCCDRVWTLEAIGNLVKNALDHTKQGQDIVLRSKRSGTEVLLQIEDHGMGIKEEDLFHIFKRFFRSENSKDLKGVGLGLPLAKEIIERQKGIIQVESQIGVGSTFSVYFPAKT